MILVLKKMFPITVRVFDLNFKHIYDLKRDSVTSIGFDNTYSNIGQRKFIASRGKECHILHNAASNAATVGFDFEDHCADLSFGLINEQKENLF